MRNIPVWAKLALALAVSTLVTLAVAGAGFYASLRVEAALEHVTGRSAPALEALAVLRNAQTAVQRAERSLLIEEFQDNPSERDRQKADLARYAAQAQEAMASYGSLPGTADSEG